MDDPNDGHGILYRWKDYIKPILKHPDVHIRDKALVAVAWESHPRPSELHKLRFGDVEDRGDYIVIRFTGPNGRERSLNIRGSMPYFKKWTRVDHPVTELVAEDADPLVEAPPDTPVWVQPQSNEILSLQEFHAVTERASKCTDVPTRFTLSDIRLSRAILLAIKLGRSTSAFEERFGWGLHEPKEFNRLLREDGLIDGVRLHPLIRCPECGERTPQYQPCLWCGTSLT